jgi:hypothetical protein
MLAGTYHEGTLTCASVRGLLPPSGHRVVPYLVPFVTRCRFRHRKRGPANACFSSSKRSTPIRSRSRSSKKGTAYLISADEYAPAEGDGLPDAVPAGNSWPARSASPSATASPAHAGRSNSTPAPHRPSHSLLEQLWDAGPGTPVQPCDGRRSSCDDRGQQTDPHQSPRRRPGPWIPCELSAQPPPSARFTRPHPVLPHPSELILLRAAALDRHPRR